MSNSIITQLSETQEPEFRNINTKVSKPAYRLWKYLEALGRIGGWISPKVRSLALYFGRPIPTIKRWLGELFRAGILTTKRRGPHPPLYTVLIPTTDTCKRVGPYMNPTEEPERAAPTLNRKVLSYLEGTKVAGKPADRPLVDRISRIIATDSAFERWKATVRRWFGRRNTPRSWGIFITLAESAARPSEQNAVVSKKLPAVVTPNREESRNLLASLGINANQFAFDGRR